MGGSSTGALRGAFTAAISAIAFTTVGANTAAGTFENMLGNAIVGGVMSDLQGGNFGHGFWAAGLTAGLKGKNGDFGLGPSADMKGARIMTAAVIGGTASVISGGKFANGAITGAFTQLFNAETQLAQQRKNHALAMRNHIAGLDPSRPSGRAMIAGWANEFGYENQELNILRSKFKAGQYQGLMVNSLSVDVNINALKVAADIANGVSTSLVDLGRATDNSIQAVTKTHIGTAMQVISATNKLQQYYNYSNDFSQSMVNFDMNNVRHYATNCGVTIQCR